MSWIRTHLLIAESRLRAAALVRMYLGLAIVLLSIAACRRQWGGPSAFFDTTGTSALVLMLFSAHVLRWQREGGMWMMYGFLTVATVFLYMLAVRASSGPAAPSASRAHIAGVNADAAAAAGVCLMNLRLQVSATVANFRRRAEAGAREDRDDRGGAARPGRAGLSFSGIHPSRGSGAGGWCAGAEFPPRASSSLPFASSASFAFQPSSPRLGAAHRSFNAERAMTGTDRRVQLPYRPHARPCGRHPRHARAQA